MTATMIPVSIPAMVATVITTAVATRVDDTTGQRKRA